MLRCTYVVLINNYEDNIVNLVNSIKELSGNFRKEFIFIDDGSTDNSLSILKSSVNDLPRTTIITQDNQGPSISINKALDLVTGDYVHFVEGDEILHPDSSVVLIDSCIKFGTQVAIGI
jgi:glycosyltransferase involved in cell wall biosynthesis